MAEKEKPRTPVLPFSGENESEWENELSNWDAHLPIEEQPPQAQPASDAPAVATVSGDEPASEPVAVAAGVEPGIEDESLGAIPFDENEFAETPTTVVSPPPLDDARVFEAAADEFSARATPHSDVYATIVSTVESGAAGESVFQREPAVDPPAPIFADPLAEMAADPWREGLELLVHVPARVAPVAASEGDQRATLVLLAAEMEVADTATQQAALTMAAARLTERLGDAAAADALYDDALTLQPGSPAALRARLRLAERAGDGPIARETASLLAEILDGDERDRYRALEAEWTLATGGKLDEAALAALGEGALAHALVQAEVAIRDKDLRRAASALEPAAEALGAPTGVAFAAAAARLAEVAGDVAGAARLRDRATAIARDGGDAARWPLLMAQLRDAARATPDAAAALLDDLLAILPAGEFKVACARWALALARRAGAGQRTVRLLDDTTLGPATPSWLRDRIDVAHATGARSAALGELLAEARSTWQTPGARASLDLMAADLALRDGDLGRALDIAAAGLEAAPGATPLALVAEEVARRATDRDQRMQALRLWARFDRARAAYAQSLLIDTLTEALAAAPGAGDEPVRQALAEQVAAAPLSTAFWMLAARERAAGRRAEAAAALAGGATAWAGSEIAPALRALADELRGDQPSPWPAALPGRRDRTRLGDAPEGVLAGSPGDPSALALFTLAHGQDPARLAATYASAADAVPGDEGVRLWKLWASSWLYRAGQTDAARAAAFAIHDGDPDAAWAPARLQAQRLARILADAPERARTLIRLGAGTDAASAELDPGDALRLAEAHESLGDRAAAAALLQGLSQGPLAADAARARTRLAAAARASDAEDPVGEARARVRGFVAAAQSGALADIANRLEQEPPHQDLATAPALYLGALLREASPATDGDAALSRTLAAAMAWRAAPRAADRPGLLCAWRATEVRAPASDPPFADGNFNLGAVSEESARASALAELADRLIETDDALDPSGQGAGDLPSQRGGDPRSSATLLVRAAELDAAAGQTASAEERLHAALARDRSCLPALRALRRSLVARGAAAEAASVCEREAEVLKSKDERIRVLMLAADLTATAAAPATTSSSADSGLTPLIDISPPGAGRTGEPLRRILAIDPGHLGAFERLRAILAAAGDFAGLSPVLAARIAAATNPFEVAALRLARADLLAGRLGDAEGAKVELRAVLQKEPQHGKALSRLADLLYDGGAYGEAAELYLKRALAERSPERLREIFLRIGRIYTRHQHDAKRAADAYKRVLQLEADNREALLALADLLIEIGESKNAIAVLERLVDLLSEVEQRVPYLIKLGQLYEQAGDVRQAGVRFRRAADAAPRDLAALGEMVRHFERTRDVPGRRALLDHALLLLRADLHAGKLDVEALRAIIHVMQWRGRGAAAAAGGQLLAVVSPEAADRALASETAAVAPPRARRLSALARADVDERTFPAGLPSGVRNIFRIVGEPLAKVVGDLKRYELTRADRVARGQGPREIVDPLAGEVGLREIDVYVKPARAAGEPAWLTVEPGEPPALVLGAPILALGTPGIRFAGARAARLASTHLDIVLRGTQPQTGALVGGVVRQFVTDYRHPDVPEDVMAGGVAMVARALSRRLRQEVMPFAIECAGPLDLAALHQAVRDGANQVGLLASGSLPASLAVVLATSGRTLSLANLGASPEALALLDFALSDAYDELARELETAGPV